MSTILDSLVSRYLELCPNSPPGANHRVQKIQDNLLPGIELNDILSDFSGGAGHELEGKFLSIYSSSALVANTFGPWRQNPATLKFLGHTAFSVMEFERRMTTGLPGTAPHLDVYLENAQVKIGIESKFTELLQQNTQSFSDSYSKEKLPYAEDFFFESMEYFAGKSMIFGAAQVLKHYLGLIAQASESQRTVLVYLYWLPADPCNSPGYHRHSSELREFEDHFKSEKVEFVHLTYNRVWSDMLLSHKEHAVELLRRYFV